MVLLFHFFLLSLYHSKLKERIEEDKLKSEVDEKTFGVPLDELTKREGADVPLIIQECTKYIEEKGGMILLRW